MAKQSWFAHLKWRYRIQSCIKELNTRCIDTKPHGLAAPLIVSLTSYPARYGTLALTLRCLLKQSVQPDHVQLWLTEGDEVSLPNEVLELREHGLEIHSCESMRSYTKLVPALRQDNARFIATADDDLYYPHDWLEKLVVASIENPDHVVAHRVHKVRWNPDGTIAPYESWAKNIKGTASGPELFATGVGGVLYPPHILDGRVTDVERFMELCPSTDDVWFYWMARLNGAEVHHIGPKIRILEWPDTQDTALRSHNCNIDAADNGNNNAVRSLTAHFGLPKPS